MALDTSAGGNGKVACKNRGSVNRPSPGLVTSTSTFTRAICMALGSAISSNPSIWVTARCSRTERSKAVLGRSGLRLKRDCPALPIGWPAAFHSTTSVAPSWSRMRSSASPTVADEPWATCALTVRVLAAMSAACDSSDTRARFTPATSAPSTFTSNQLSIDRVTNWYDTT